MDRIVSGKVAKGQLDQSPLTLHDLHVIRTVLARALGSMYHQRLDYPASADGAPQQAPAAG